MIEQFAERAADAGFRVHRSAVPQLDGAEISLATYALADTGSVGLLSGLEEQRLGAGLPSAVTIVTGPSRSTDIERRLAVGVHGPRGVHVVLVADA